VRKSKSFIRRGFWLSALSCFALDTAPFNADLGVAQQDSGSQQTPEEKNAVAIDVLGAGEEAGRVKSLKDPVSLEYRNAPLVDVLRSLADSARINLALSTQVADARDQVTIRLSRVTYEVALKTILDLYKLGAVVENGILRIDTQKNLSTERQDKIQSKTEIWRTEPTRTIIYQLNYAKSDELVPILSAMMAPHKEADKRFSVNADKRTNKIMIEGVADALTRARSLIEGLDRRKQQVLVEARIVEASSELSRTLSVTWGTRFGLDAQRGLSSGVVFPNSVVGNIGGAGSLGGTAPAPGQGMGPSQLGSMGFTLGSINGMVNIDGILRAYETESLANIIASPRLVMEDQETASLDERGTVARNVLVGDASQSRQTSSQLSLSVKPQITSDNTVELDLTVQRKTPNNAPTDPVQGSTDRTVKTRLMVENGDTAVIGGLYQTQKFRGQGRIPFLGRLPIIGFLFRTNDSQMARSELMVLITPRILPVGKRLSGEGPLMGSSESGPSDSAGAANTAPTAEARPKNNSNSNVMANAAGGPKAGSDEPASGAGAIDPSMMDALDNQSAPGNAANAAPPANANNANVTNNNNAANNANNADENAVPVPDAEGNANGAEGNGNGL